MFGEIKLKIKIINIIFDILLITLVFAITDYFMLNVFKSENIWLELGIYIVFYGVMFGTKNGVMYLWKRYKNKTK